MPIVFRVKSQETIMIRSGGILMKRILLGIVAAGIILTIGATTAFAAGLHNRCAGGAGIGICRNGESCGYYADADGDGICDNCGNTAGTCTGNAACSSYVDADGDGVCDICGGGHGNCVNGGLCGNYADADGDGFCDNAAAWSGAGHHGGCGEGCRESRCGANRR